MAKYTHAIVVSTDGFINPIEIDGVIYVPIEEVHCDACSFYCGYCGQCSGHHWAKRVKLSEEIKNESTCRNFI